MITGVESKATCELGMAMMKHIIQHSQFPLRGVLPQRGPILPWMSEPFSGVLCVQVA